MKALQRRLDYNGGKKQLKEAMQHEKFFWM